MVNVKKLIEHAKSIQEMATKLGFVNMRVCKPVVGDSSLTLLVALNEMLLPNYFHNNQLKNYIEELEISSKTTIMTEGALKASFKSPFWKKMYEPVAQSAIHIHEISSNKAKLEAWYPLASATDLQTTTKGINELSISESTSYSDSKSEEAKSSGLALTTL